jgi:hypothetical protein
MSKIVMLVVLCALVPASAMAQCCLSLPELNSVRARVGYFDLGDMGGEVGAGVDVRFGLLGQKWLAGVEAAGGTDMLDANVNLLMDVPLVAADVYIGGGAGIYRVDRHGETDQCPALQGVVGISTGVADLDDWFLEARYVLGTDFDYGKVNVDNIDGIRLTLGYQHRF